MRINFKSFLLIFVFAVSTLQTNAQEFWRRLDDVRLEVRKSIRFAGDITPDTLDASANNYDPEGLSNASVLRLRASTAVNLTGLAGGSDGKILYVYNIGSSAITFKDESGSSTAANRFALAADVVLSGDESIMLQYDASSSRWRLYSKSVSTDLTAATSVSASWSFTGDITVDTITTSQNDYDPTGLSGATVIRLRASGAVNITGLAGGADGRVLILVNTGTQTITLKDESVSSTASNRFALTGDVAIAADGFAIILYDATSSRWRVISS